MAILRILFAVLGALFIGLGFYALIAGLIDWSEGLSFSFHSADTVFADVFDGIYTNTIGGSARAFLNDLPAFFTLTILGIIMVWRGTRPQKPKPKFRKA